jgi:hypothetical protein
MAVPAQRQSGRQYHARHDSVHKTPVPEPHACQCERDNHLAQCSHRLDYGQQLETEILLQQCPGYNLQAIDEIGQAEHDNYHAKRRSGKEMS